MTRILACNGTLAVEANAEGRKPPEGVQWPPVRVVLSYEVRLGAAQALKVDVYGRQLIGFGAIWRELPNRSRQRHRHTWQALGWRSAL